MTYTYKSRRLVAKNSQYEVFLDDIESDDGYAVDDYLVVAPITKAEDLNCGVAVFPIYQGKVALLKIFRQAVRDYSWEIPRGFLDPDEELTESASRELLEETGLWCPTEKLKDMGPMAPDAGVIASRCRIFLAENCSVKKQFSPHEIGHRQLAFFSLSEFENMILNAEIQDPCTAIAGYRYRLLRQRG